MQKGIPWPRVLGEAVVIVVSILLGLSLDAWWDRRQAVRLEADILTAVRNEVASNRAALRDNGEANQAHLELIDRFLRSDSEALGRVTRDSTRVWIQAFARPLTFDPRSGAASLLSDMAVLSREGVQARAFVSEWITRVDDAEEEKTSLWESALAVQTRLAPYASRAGRGGGNVAELVSSLGPAVLGELRADSGVVDAIVLKSINEQVYLRQLEGLSSVLDSMEVTLRAN